MKLNFRSSFSSLCTSMLLVALCLFATVAQAQEKRLIGTTVASQSDPHNVFQSTVIYTMDEGDNLQVLFDSDDLTTELGATWWGLIRAEGLFWGIADGADATIYSFDSDKNEIERRATLTGADVRYSGEMLWLEDKLWGAASAPGFLYSYTPGASDAQVEHTFDGGVDGGTPMSLIEVDGLIWGLLTTGGANGNGAIFTINPTTNALTKVHDFAADERFTLGRLTEAYGRVYGIIDQQAGSSTLPTGASQQGILFSMAADGTDYQEEYLFDKEAETDSDINKGRLPRSIMAHDGKLWGTTIRPNNGNVFQFDPQTKEFKVVHTFNQSNGQNPYAKLTSYDGKLWGVTFDGGVHGNGVAYTIDPETLAFTQIRQYTNDGPDSPDRFSLVPYDILPPTIVNPLPDQEIEAGATGTPINLIGRYNDRETADLDLSYKIIHISDESVFPGLQVATDNTLTLTPSLNSAGNVTVVLEVTDSDGLSVKDTMQVNVLAKAPKLIGVSASGASTNPSESGITIYTINKNGDFNALFADHQTLQGVGSGHYGLTRSGGKFWGVTYGGGDEGYGVLFSLELDGTGFNKIFDFPYSYGIPRGALVESNGRLWGAASNFARGLIYSLKTDGTDLRTHYQFPYVVGFSLNRLLVVENELIGLAEGAGANGEGFIFKIDNNGANYQQLFDFPVDDGYSDAELILAGGRLWGTTSGAKTGSPRNIAFGDLTHGTVFSIKPDGTDYQVVHRFAKTNSSDADVLDGRHVVSPLFNHDNKLWGNTEFGGENGGGVIFYIDLTDNSFHKIFDFDGPTTGHYPRAGLTYFDGDLWSVTTLGGANDAGTIYRLNPSTLSFQKVRDMELAAGAYPVASIFIPFDAPAPSLTFANVPDTEILEDAASSEIDLTPYATGSGVTYELVEVSNTGLFPAITVSESGAVTILPAADAYGTAEVTVKAKDSSGNEVEDSFNVVVLPVADTPTVTDAQTTYGSQTTTGLLLAKNGADGTEVTHYQITDIQNGLLFQADGITSISNGDFITLAQGTSGLKFSPASAGTGSFKVQASLNTAEAGLGGDKVATTIIVNKAQLTITVQDEAIDVGADIPIFSLQYSGFVNGEDESAITPPTAATTATSASAVGTYPITLSGGASDNYAFTRLAGALTINGSVSKLIGVSGHGTSTNPNDWGITVYSIDKEGTFNPFYTSNRSDGLVGSGKVEVTRAGGKYWVVTYGGGSRIYGTLFTLELDGTGFNKIFDFPSAYGYPSAALVESNGRLWGTAGVFGKDVIYSLKTDGTDIRVDQNFARADGDGISMSKLLVIDNELFGVAKLGGTNDEGVLFKIDNTGNNYQKLFDFPVDEGYPETDLIVANGRLWGTTSGALTGSPRNIVAGDDTHGTVFSIKTDGTDYQLVHRFAKSNASDSDVLQGRHVTTPLVKTDNKLWGNAQYGGVHGGGTIFYIDLTDNGFNKAYDFEQASGHYARGALSEHNGELWGTTFLGGDNDYGTIYRYDPSALTYHKVRDMELTSGAYPLDARFVLHERASSTLEFANVPDAEILEDAASSEIDLTPYATGSGVTYELVEVSNTSLFSAITVSESGAVTIQPAADAHGTAEVTVKAKDSSGNEVEDSFNVVVLPVADTPTVTDAQTTYGSQTTTGLVISKNASDGAEVTHYRVTDIQNGLLFQADGTTLISNGDFITLAQGTSGLKFSPASAGTGSFKVQASLSAVDGGLGGDKATTTIIVNKAQLTITVQDEAIDVGADIPTFSLQFSGFVNGEDESAITPPTAATTATSSSAVGTYPITLSGGASGNYAFTRLAGTLTINAKPTKMIGVSAYGTSEGSTSWGTTVYSIDKSGTFNTIFTDLQSDGRVGSGQSEVTFAGGKYWIASVNGGTGVFGTLFTIDPDGSNYNKVIDFNSTYGYPGGALVESNGRLWGASYIFGDALIYSIKTDATDLRIDHQFTKTAGLRIPKLHLAGNEFFGVSYGGGAHGEGFIFKIDNNGTNYQTLFNFPVDDGYPRSELLWENGRLWGTTSGAVTGSPQNLKFDDDTYGTVFSIKPDGSDYQVVHRFDKTNESDSDVLEGRHAISHLVKADNKLWGNTQYGGAHGGGVIFYIDLADNGFHKVFDYQESTGRYPRAGLDFHDGELWGTTSQGGTYNYGTIYRFNPSTLTFVKLRDMELEEALPLGARLVPYSDTDTPSLEFANVPDVVILEDAETSQVDLTAYASGTDVTFELVSVSNTTLFPELTVSNDGKVNVKPYLNRFGSAEVVVKATDVEGTEVQDTFIIEVTPVADSPEITAENTTYGSTELAKVQVERHLTDGLEVSHFQVSNIQNGVLYLSDGKTLVAEGSFLTFEGASRGLRFMAQNAGVASFEVRAATGSEVADLGENTLAQITVAKAPLTVSVVDLDITTGQDIPVLTFDYDGFVNGDDAASITEPTIATAAVNGSAVGIYDIVLSGGDATNYSFSLINGLLTISESANAPLDEFEDRLVGTGTYAAGSSAFGSSIFTVTEGLSIENWLSVNGADGTMGQARWTLVEADDKLWGVTYGGGANDLGILFTINKDGTGFTKVHDFGSSYGYPTSGLTLAGGYLYGATAAGFGQNTGVIYRITTDNTTPEMVHEFSNRDGWAPRGLIEAGGKLYGMTHYGGDNSQGVIFSLNVDGSGFEKIYDFETEKGKPEGELLFAQGRLWGTAKASRFDYPRVLQNTDPAGLIFSVLPDGSNFRIEHTFIKSNPGDAEYKNGRHPFGNLVEAEGKLWGMTPFGGENGFGVIYQLDPATSIYQKVHDFATADGTYPRGSFLSYNAKLWGMTYEGGVNGLGTVFTLDPNDNAFTKIADLTDATGGKSVDGHLMLVQTKKKFSVELPDVTIEEGAGEQVLELATYFEAFLDKVTGTPVYSLSANSAPTLMSQTAMTGSNLSFTPAEQASGSTSLTISLSGDQGEVASGNFKVTILPVIDGIEVTEAITATYGTIATEVIEVARHEFDNDEVSHFKVTGLTGLELYLPDGSTQVSEGDFLTFAQAQSGLKVLPRQVGDLTINLQAATAASDDALGGDVAEVSLTAQKADLYITAESFQINYGDALPLLNLNYQGFVSGESEAAITAPGVSTTATANSDAGEYVISVTGGAADNYNLHLENGLLTIAKVILNVSVSDDYLYVPTRIQPSLSIEITGFVNGEDQSVLDALPEASSPVNAYSPVGDYLVAVTGGTAKNYTFNRISGTIRVGSGAPETGDIGNPDNRRGKFVLVGTSTYNGGTLFSIDATDYTKRWHLFNSLTSGQNPISNLEEADEKLWGVTSIGGDNTAGVLYSISKDQVYAKVHDFDFTNGAQPIGTPVFANGRLWGTTSLGGANNQGVIYSIKADGTDYNVHYNFDGTTGAFPSNGLLLAGDKLWGMTTFGGANQRGVIYNIATDGTGFAIVHEFADKKGIPFGELVLAGGKLWGLTRESQGPQQFFVAGDAEDNGAIFSIELDGTGYSEVHNFEKVDDKDLGLKNGRHPHGSLVAYDGALWGMTTYGGDVAGSNFGTIFKLDISGATPVFTKKHDFDAQQTGGYPKGNLVVFEDQLWGMTSERGQSNLGAIFSFNPTTEGITARHQFDASIGGNSVTSFQRVFIDLIPTLKQALPDQKVNEGTAQISVDLNEYFSDQDLQSANLDYEITVTGAPGIVSQSELAGNTLNLFLNDNAVGKVNVTVKASAAIPATVSDVFELEVTEMPDAPVVMDINATYGMLSTERVMITKNPLDGPDVNFFQVTDISNGLLYHTDGVSQVTSGDFISIEQGQSGLRFLPTQVGQGTFSVQASTQNSATGLGPDKATATITSGKATLQVKATDLTAAYGAPLPVYTLTYSGFVQGDGVGDITPPVASSLATSTSDAHTYVIELTGGTSDNYELQLIDGLLNIEKVALIASADDKAISHGDELPEFTISYTGFLNDDSPSDLTQPVVSTTYETADGPGQYELLLEGGFSENYSITREDGNLEVAKLQLVITADNKEIVYGQSLPELTLSVSALEDGSSPIDLVLPTLSVNASDNPAAGEYTIALTGGNSATYDLVLQTGTLKVTKAPLTITADYKSLQISDAFPDLTMSFDGFVNGDDEMAITKPTITSKAENTNSSGLYAITLSGGAADNYELTLVNGLLDISRILLTVTADNKQFTYGQEVPAFTLSYEGFIDGDDASNILTPSVTSEATSTSPVGDYDIRLSGGASAKYGFRLVKGTVTVKKANVLIQVDDKVMTYGDKWTSPTATTTGLVPGDENLVSALPYSITIRQKVAFTPFAGTYTINLNESFSLDNYEVEWRPGTLMVNKATLNVTADDKASNYSEDIPALSFSYNGFVSIDTEADITAPAIGTSATNESNAGTYPILLTGGAADNYDIVLTDGTLTIGKAGLTITADDKQMAYGESVPDLTLTYEGFVNGEDATALNLPTASADITENSPTGTYPITLAGGAADNYDLTLVNGELTIGKSQLTVTANNQSFIYGSEVPELTLSYEGFVNGDDASDITAPLVATTASSTSDAGTYDITLSGGESDNYEMVLVNGTATISKASLTITANNEAITYGESLPDFSATVTGLVAGDEAVIAGLTYSTAASASPAAGAYAVTPTGVTAPNYELELVPGTLTVSKATLTATAEDKAITYGEEIPALSISYSGFVNGESEADITAPSIGSSATNDSDAGTYTISLSGGASDNYDIQLTNGALTIGKANLTITADDKQIEYGEAVPDWTFTYEGFVNGDDAGDLNLPNAAADVTENSPTGTYPITLAGGTAENYDLTLVNGKLTIGKFQLTVTANNQTFTYGSEVPELTLSYEGFVNGDDASDITAPLAATTATSTSDVGTYDITLSGGASDNYEIVLVKGTATISKANLKIATNDEAITYGESLPDFSATVTGLVAGDEAVIVGLTYSTSASSMPDAGAYAVTPTGVTAPNYELELVPGTLTVSKATLTATAEDKAITYGEEIPAFSISYSGFITEESVADITAPSIGTSATNDSDAGTYAISLSGGAADNYDIQLTNGTLTIGKASITITADDKQIEYGEAVPDWTFTYEGFVNGDDAGDLNLPTAGASVTENSPAGTYPITLAGGTADNYDLTLVNGELNIGKTELTVTANNQAFIYGTEVPELTLSYNGFVNGDDASNITAPVATTSATSTSDIGTYDITLSGGASDNYEIVLVKGTATISKASLTIIANDESIAYGESLPDFSATITGLVAGDESAIAGLSYASTAGTSPAVGSYTILPAGVITSSNYELEMVSGTLTVGKATLTATAEDKAITYGEDIPALSFSYTGFVTGETEADITTPVISTIATKGSDAGTYPISLTGGAADNYDIQLTDGTLTIGKAALTIRVSDEEMTYGSSVPGFTANYTGLVNGEVADQVTLSSTAGSAPASGTYAIVANLAGLSNYETTVEEGTLTVNKASLIITANDQQKTFGAAIPALTLTYDGFKNGDSANDINPPQVQVNANDQSEAGVYPITLTGGTAANYNLTLVNGELTIGKTVLTVTADTKAFTYGNSVPALTLSYQGFTNGDDESNIEPPVASTTVGSKSNAGTYDIILTGGTSSKYELVLVDGTITVNKASLSIEANDVNITYGESIPGYTATVTGLVAGDESLLTSLSYATSAGTTPDGGTYSITPEGVTADNYELEMIPGTLTVAKAELTVMAEGKAITYGEALPALSMKYEGFIGSDGESDITAPAIATTATSGSNVGDYPITLSGGASANYDFVLNDASLTITKAAATLRIKDQQMTYGSAVPAFSADYIDLVNGDNAGDFTGKVSLTSTAGANPGSGTYTIDATLSAIDNYELTVEKGTLTVNKAGLSIRADHKRMTYGGSVPSWTLSYFGFVNGDDEDEISIPQASSEASSQSDAGEYPIALSGGIAANYNITLVNGICTITPVTLRVQIESASMHYGEAIPQLSYQIFGFAADDDESDLTTPPVISHNVSSQTAVGTYLMSISGASSTNYNFIYVPGNLTVLPAELKIIAEDLNMIYGNTPPQPAISYQGFVNGEGPSVFTSAPTAVVNAVSSTSVGSYPIQLRGGAAANYDIELVDGTITIAKAALFATAKDLELTFGSNIPQLEIVYEGFKAGDNELDIAPPFPVTQANARANVGTYPIELRDGSALNYELIKTDGMITIVKAEQTINFTVDQMNVRPSQEIELNASSTSGLTLNFTVSDEDLMSIANGVATPLNNGRVTVTASHPGNQNFHAAESVSRSFNIVSRIAPGRVQRIDLAYPNPTTNTFRVKEPVDMIEIYDQQGLRVKKFEGDFDSYDVSDLKRGIYTVFYYKDGDVGMSRLMIWR